MTTYYQPKPEGWELLRFIGEYAARMYEAKVTVRIETQNGAVVEQQFSRIAPKSGETGAAIDTAKGE